jgi:O-antigen/teichoic acid export membrane protein
MRLAATSILTNTALATAGRLINAALGVVIAALLGRTLGASGYGSYTALLAYAAILQIAADAGLYLTLTQAISRQPEQEIHYISHIIWLRLVLFAVVFSVGGLVVALVPSLQISPLLFVVATGGYVAQSLSQLLMSIYQKYGRVWRATVGDLIGRGVQIGLIIGFSLGVLSVSGAVLAFAVGTIVAFAVHRRLLPLRRIMTRQISVTTWKQLIRLSWPLGLMLLLNAIYFRVDAVLLSYFRTPAEVGVYGLAYRIIESALFFPAMFGGLLLPRLTRSLSRADGHASQWLSQGLTLLVPVIGLLIVTLVFLAGPLIILVAGTEFIDSVPLLRILVVALVVMFFGNLFGFTLVALQRQRALLILYALLVVVNAGLNVIYIPQYGAAAAAWTTVITEVLAAGCAAVLVGRELRYRLSWAVLFKTAVATSAAGLVVFLLPPTVPLLLTIVLTLGVFGVIIWWLKVIQYRDVGLLLTELTHENV